MKEPIIIIYATHWCGDCIRVRRFFRQNNIPFEWIDIDDCPEGERFVLETNHGMRSVPTIVFPDGSIQVEPSNLQLAVKLDL